MIARSRYRQLVLEDQGRTITARALTEVVDDVIGLDPAPGYLEHLERTYGSFLPAEFLPQVKAWIASQEPERFLRGARAAAAGRLSGIIGNLERLTYRPDGSADVPAGDLLALAAFALLELVRNQELIVHKQCGNCSTPFLSIKGGAGSFCNRPARAADGTRLARSCREVEKARIFDETRKAYRREYRNVHERVQRGTLPRDALDLWMSEFGPGGPEEHLVQPFNHWIESATSRRARQAGFVTRRHQRAKAHDQEGG